MRTSKSACDFVKYGYGQVEPNHLSAQRTGQIYAQLPAAADIDVLENGQFAKYDYANEEVNFTGAGEWMLVFNEVKVYRDGEMDCDFAMRKNDYEARMYSPRGAKLGYFDASGNPIAAPTNTRFYGPNANGVVDETGAPLPATNTAVASDFEIDSTADPFAYTNLYGAAKAMKAGTTMVPRLFKTNVGDIFTTNTIKDATVAVSDILNIGADGYLAVGAAGGNQDWQVVKVYTMPDGQPGAKIMRIA